MCVVAGIHSSASSSTTRSRAGH